MSIMEVGYSTYFCDAVGPKEMNIYGLAGMGGFYFFSYLSRPWRILRSIKIYRNDRSDTVFEERLFALFRRWKLEKQPESSVRDDSEQIKAPFVESEK